MGPLYVLDEPAFRGDDLRCGPAYPKGHALYGRKEPQCINFIELAEFKDKVSAHQARGRVGRQHDKAFYFKMSRNPEAGPAAQNLDVTFHYQLTRLVQDSARELSTQSRQRATYKKKLENEMHRHLRDTMGDKYKRPHGRSKHYKEQMQEAAVRLNLSDYSPSPERAPDSFRAPTQLQI